MLQSQRTLWGAIRMLNDPICRAFALQHRRDHSVSLDIVLFHRSVTRRSRPTVKYYRNLKLQLISNENGGRKTMFPRRGRLLQSLVYE